MLKQHYKTRFKFEMLQNRSYCLLADCNESDETIYDHSTFDLAKILAFIANIRNCHEAWDQHVLSLSLQRLWRRVTMEMSDHQSRGTDCSLASINLIKILQPNRSSMDFNRSYAITLRRNMSYKLRFKSHENKIFWSRFHILIWTRLSLEVCNRHEAISCVVVWRQFWRQTCLWFYSV